MKSIIYILSTIFGISTTVVLSSCNKPKTGKAIIKVIDISNQPVVGATVNLNSENNKPPGTVKGIKTTYNTDGKYYFEFPLEVILNVEVSKGNKIAPKNNIHIIPGKTVNLTIKLK